MKSIYSSNANYHSASRRYLSHTAHRRRAFTLIELLVVLTIVSILISLLLPALAAAREAGNNASCKSKMHQMFTASVSYCADFKAMPGGRHFETQKTSGFPTQSNIQHFSLIKSWTRGPGVTVKNMELGYLPEDKNVAWCPSKIPYEGTGGKFFWERPISDKEWGLTGSAYGVNGQVFNSVQNAADNYWQYEAGGAIPEAKWDQYQRAYYVSEIDSGHMVLGKASLDPGTQGGLARHADSLNVLFPPGQVLAFTKPDLDFKFDNTDPEFLWGL